MELSEADAAYARKIAARFRPYGILDQDDYEAIALCAAWKARQSYRAEHGARWNTWAHHAIVGDIRHAMRDQSGVSRHAWDRGERMEVEGMPAWWDEADPDPLCQPEQQAMDRAGVVEIFRWAARLPPGQKRALAQTLRGAPRTSTAKNYMKVVRKKLRAARKEAAI